MFKQIIVFFALCITQLIVASSNRSMFNLRVNRKIVQTVKEVDAVFCSPVYTLPGRECLKPILATQGPYTDDEINTLQGQKLTANELLWELLHINEHKQYVWRENQPTIFQLVDNILKVSTQCQR